MIGYYRNMKLLLWLQDGCVIDSLQYLMRAVVNLLLGLEDLVFGFLVLAYMYNRGHGTVVLSEAMSPPSVEVVQTMTCNNQQWRSINAMATYSRIEKKIKFKCILGLHDLEIMVKNKLLK